MYCFSSFPLSLNDAAKERPSRLPQSFVFASHSFYIPGIDLKAYIAKLNNQACLAELTQVWFRFIPVITTYSFYKTCEEFIEL